MVTGYLHHKYAESLQEFGTPRELPRCAGWVLVRQIPGSPYYDGMGCYPIFACRDWSQLHADLKSLGDDLVTLTLITDPFWGGKLEDLQRCFDLVIPFKEHFVSDLSRPITEIVSKHHRKNARRALRDVCVERCPDPEQFLDEWADLYAVLIKRHDIGGIRAFSRQGFSRQLRVPGMVCFRVVYQDDVVGGNLFYVQGDVAYGHLSAFSPQGYALGASYAVKWAAIEYFADKLRWLTLGAGAGVWGDDSDGLTRFKRGWSTGTRTAYLCGRIFDQGRYSEVVRGKGVPSTGYFPAYRSGEFE